MLLLAAPTACGSDSASTPVLEPEPTATPKTDAPATSEGVWRADIAVGPAHGDRAANASVTLADGSTTTLESAAGGRAILLYFFATW